MKLTSSHLKIPSCHIVVWPVHELLTGFPESWTISVNRELGSAGEAAMSDYLSLECQGQDGKIHELLGEPFVYCISLTMWLLSPCVNFWLEFRMCSTVLTFKMKEMAHIWKLSLPFDLRDNLFMYLNVKDSTASWYTHTDTHTHKYKHTMYLHCTYKNMQLDIVKKTWGSESVELGIDPKLNLLPTPWLWASYFASQSRAKRKVVSERHLGCTI